MKFRWQEPDRPSERGPPGGEYRNFLFLELHLRASLGDNRGWDSATEPRFTWVKSLDPSTGSITAPIYQTSTYVQRKLRQNRKATIYARTFAYPESARPRTGTVAKTRRRANLAYVFTSIGMAAIDAMFRLSAPATTSSSSDAVYGGVHRLTTQLLVQFGLEFSFVDTSHAESVRRAVRPNTKMLHVETPTNPTMIVTDIAEMAAIAKESNFRSFAVDNTFLSPYPATNP